MVNVNVIQDLKILIAVKASVQMIVICSLVMEIVLIINAFVTMAFTDMIAV
jgi:hypothetical protein